MSAKKEDPKPGSKPDISTKPVPAIRAQAYQLLIKLALRDFEGKHIPDGALDKIKDQAGQVPNIYNLYANIRKCIHTFLRNPVGSVKPDLFKESLRELKLPEDCVVELANVLCGPRRALMDSASLSDSFCSKLESLRWRIDVTISSSVLARVLEPTLTLELRLNNGKTQTFQVSVAKFHELRFYVATLLKEMETIERKKLFRKAIGAT